MKSNLTYLVVIIILIGITGQLFQKRNNNLKVNNNNLNILLEELEEDYLALIKITNNNEEVQSIDLVIDEHETVDLKSISKLVNKLIIKIPGQACTCFSKQLLELFSKIPHEVSEAEVFIIVPMNQILEYKQFFETNNILTNTFGCYESIHVDLDKGLNPYCFTINQNYEIKDLLILKHNIRIISKYMDEILNRYY